MIPVNLEMKNFFSHKSSSVDFSQFDSALLVGNIDGDYDVSNGSGKSAIFEAILWCLFNKSRAASQDDVIFWGENLCKVQFIFKHSGDLYQVIRKRNRSNTSSSVEFSRKDSNGNWIDISGSTAGLTNSEIIKVIKFDYKTFVNSAYFRQNDISEFAETDASRKKAILKSIIDISKWDDYETLVKNDRNLLRGECKVLAARLEGYEVLVAEFEESKFNLGKSANELEKLSLKRKSLRSLIDTMNNSYQNKKSALDTDQWDKASIRLAALKDSLKAVMSKSKVSADTFREYDKLVKEKTKEISELKKYSGAIIYDERVYSKIKDLNAKSIDLKGKFSSSTTIISRLEKRNIVKGQCYVCKQDVDEDLYGHLSKEHDNDLAKHNREIIFSKNKLNEISDNLVTLEGIAAKNKVKKTTEATISNKEIELKITKERLNELADENDEISLEELKIRDDIKMNNDILDSIRDDSFRGLQKELSLKKDEVTRLNTELEASSHKVGVLTEKSSNLEVRIAEMDAVREKYVEKQKEVGLLDRMVKLLGKNGIQTILLNALIEDLEKTANDILTSICNESFILYLDTQRVGSDGVSIVDTLDLRVKKDGIVQNFKSLSGGEKFRVSLALRIALSEISSRHGGSALEFLLLDEINSPLDRSGTESLFSNVISSLEKKYKILVITHNDSLKEKFGNILEVTKVNGESTVNYLAI